MKHQDQYQHDDTLRSLEDIFKPVGDDSFFLNTQNILAADHIVSTGKTYVLFDFIQGKLTSAKPVVLKRVLDTHDGINLILIDMLTNKVLARKLATGHASSKLQWKLCDLDVLVNANNLDIIEDVKTPNSHDLLEFDF